MSKTVDDSKRSAARKAATYVEDGMTLGIGTGSTARHFIDALGELIAGGWSLSGIPTSEETHRLAVAAGVTMIEPDHTTEIALAVDGADEVDPALNLIKGGGGALLREKIVANTAKKFIVIADQSKRVETLGAFPLPVEIDHFASHLTMSEVRRTFARLGIEPQNMDIRSNNDAPFQTDGGNLIVDCSLGVIDDPAALESALVSIPGVIDCGLFCGLTDMVIYGNGTETTTVTA